MYTNADVIIYNIYNISYQLNVIWDIVIKMIRIGLVNGFTFIYLNELKV